MALHLERRRADSERRKRAISQWNTLYLLTKALKKIKIKIKIIYTPTSERFSVVKLYFQKCIFSGNKIVDRQTDKTLFSLLN